MDISQTQLANYSSFAGIIVFVALYFGHQLDQGIVTFLLFAVWQTLCTGYNFYQRYKKGDITLAGIRK